MAFEQERKQLEQLQQIAAQADRDRLLSRFEELVNQHGAATDATVRADIEKQIGAILDEAKARARPEPTSGTGWKSAYTLALALFVTGSYLVIVIWYFGSLKGNYTIESTRLLIVLTLIIAMLGFGGLLIARALFASESGTVLQERFRLAREIFLVFSGIFGTIIGFYFGAADSEPATEQPQVELSWANGQLTAAMTGGVAPFTGIFTPKDSSASEVQQTNSRTLTYEVTPCPQAASVRIVDGRGRQAEATIDCNASAPDGAGTADPTPDNAEENASGNAAGNLINNSAI